MKREGAVEGRYDAIIVGGGFFGCSLALHLRRLGRDVAVIERGDEVMGRASYANQARVHNGYHYPRSLLTAYRSRINFPRFVQEYRDCIADDFEACYAVARRFSNVTAAQYRLFCERVGAPIERASPQLRGLFDSDLVEDVFRVTEYAFDAERLRVRTLEALQGAGAEMRLGTEAVSLAAREGGEIEVLCRRGGEESRLRARRVFNCTYSRINQLLRASSLPTIPLKHEIAEIALVRVPPPLERVGVTLMCGPFFSVMPFPARNLHSLSHVRYTPHGEWRDGPEQPPVDAYSVLEAAPKRSNFERMRKDAERFLPCLRECEYESSLWEVKTVLPVSEVDDSRPILYVRDHGIENLTCIMGGKIDNVFDMLEFQEAGQDAA